ncbi:MAG: hypothetical protein Q8K37_05645, partial [Alphaproteobacteria bacterium]|nr:hypothetical protein [Alphaproteobacteria bacterium]
DIHPNDVLITLGHCADISTKSYLEKASALNTPIINIGQLTASFKMSNDLKLQKFAEHLATNIILKMITTQFAILSGWVLEGEMINLDPNNPNKKLIARRVQTLKNLKLTDNEDDALKLLDETKNDLALAVVMKRKNVDCQKAATILSNCNGNVVKAIL